MRSIKLAIAIALVCAQTPLLGQGGEPSTIEPPTQADIAAAMRSPWSDHFESDGTARGDSARRIGALGVWDLEGGDRDRGVRLVRAARQMGLADSSFFLQAGLYLHNLGVLDEALPMYEAAASRWPALVWAWEGQAKVLTALGRPAESETARRRAAELRATH
jgi:tetratricopeptide (TPR) repeat protein